MFTFNVTMNADLSSIETKLKLIHERLLLMPTKQEFDAAMAEIDAATTEIANDLQKLIDQGFIAQEGLDTINTKIAALKALGAQQ